MQLDKNRAVMQQKLQCLERQNALEDADPHNDTIGKRAKSGPERIRSQLASPATVKASPFEGRQSKKERRKVTVLEQWVEIARAQDGKTVTTLHPPNGILIQRLQKMWPTPELVYRRLHFVGSVPEEYSWSTDNLLIRTAGGMGMQRMTIDTWLKLIEKEKKEGNGHLLPTHNLPRPQERGGCDCRVCVNNRKLLKDASGH